MFRTSSRLLIATYLPAAAMLAALATISIYTQIPIARFMHDSTALARVSPFTGLLSNLGILLWCASAAACVLSGLTLHHTSHKAIARFLIASSLLTAIILFDDLFQFHEVLAPHYLGLSETTIYVVHGLVIILYLLVFRRVILQTGYALLCCALVFFAISVAIDKGLARWPWKLGSLGALPEDGSKFLGIASWCAYYMQVSFKALVDRLSQTVPGPTPTLGGGGNQETRENALPANS